MREARWWVILACPALATLWVIVVIFGLYRPHITTSVFLVSLAGLLIVGGGLLIGAGRLRLRDVGLRGATILSGAGWTLVAWLALQIIAVIADLITYGRLLVNATWGQVGVLGLLGLFVVGQLLGNSLYEEVVWRGFLVPQLALKLRRTFQRPAIRWTVAIGVSQLFFALYHIPIRLYTGETPADLASSLAPIWVLGMLLAIIYARTSNLYLVIGLHALNDLPLLIFAVSPFMAQFIGSLPIVGAALALGVGAAWRAWRRRTATVAKAGA